MKIKFTLELIVWVNNVMRVFRFLVRHICLVLWMMMKKHISALVCVAITFIMLLGVQQLEKSYSVQRSWECEGQICNLHPTRARYIRTFTSKISITDTNSSWNITRQISHDKYHTDLIIVKESNHENKVHLIKTRYTITGLCSVQWLNPVAWDP